MASNILRLRQEHYRFLNNSLLLCVLSFHFLNSNFLRLEPRDDQVSGPTSSTIQSVSDEYS